MKLLRGLGVMAIVSGLAAPVFAQPAPPATGADAVGTWNVTFNTPQQAVPAQLVLKKDGDKMTGTVSSDMGSAPVEAQLKGKQLDIWFTFQGQNGPMQIEMTGNMEGDTVKGPLAIGGSPGGDWVATRAKDATDAKDAVAPTDTKSTDVKESKAARDQPATSKVDLSGTWNVSVELPSMTATPMVVLKQDGEKLTGEYVSAQYGRFPITGTVKGNDVSFWFAMNVEGNALNVTYTGTVNKDGGLSGAVNYGDMMSGTYTASKKK
jgi:hypothetical protein